MKDLKTLLIEAYMRGVVDSKIHEKIGGVWTDSITPSITAKSWAEFTIEEQQKQ